MGHEWQKVLVQVAAMSLVILLGWIVRKRGYLDSGLTLELSRLVVDITFPALIFVQMVRTVDWATLSASWYIPLVGAATLTLIFGMSFVGALATGVRQGRGTVVFLSAMPNWVFLPLPIALALYGARGATIILLFNVGLMPVIWTLGVWSLHGGRIGWRELRRIVFNPGFLATIIGIFWALYVPGPAAWSEKLALPVWAAELVSSTTLTTLELVAALTVPLSLIAVGAQMGERKTADVGTLGALFLTLILRLLGSPLLVLGLLVLARWFGFYPPREFIMISALIAAMPVGSSCGVIAERYGGQAGLAARSIFASTLLAVFTVPLFFMLTELIFPAR